jgi:hypothetical protein
MNVSRIEDLVLSVPGDVPLYTRVTPGTSARPTQEQIVERTNLAVWDPHFPWLYAAAFANAKRRLPCEANEDYLRTAHEFSANGRMCREVKWALMLQNPASSMTRYMLEALLLIPSQSIEAVSRISGIDVEIINTYEQLFFNVRDRLNDLIYINKIVYPETRHPEAKPSYYLNAHPGRLMLISAMQPDGENVEAILNIYGTRTNTDKLAYELLSKAVENRTLSDAYRLVSSGGANQSHSPVLNRAMQLLVAARSNPMLTNDTSDAIAGLTALALNPGQSALATIKGITNNDAYDAALARQTVSRQDWLKVQEVQKPNPSRN